MNHTNNIWKDFVYNGRHYEVEHKDPFLLSGRCRGRQRILKILDKIKARELEKTINIHKKSLI